MYVFSVSTGWRRVEATTLPIWRTLVASYGWSPESNIVTLWEGGSSPSSRLLVRSVEGGGWLESTDLTI